MPCEGLDSQGLDGPSGEVVVSWRAEKDCASDPPTVRRRSHDGLEEGIDLTECVQMVRNSLHLLHTKDFLA